MKVFKIINFLKRSWQLFLFNNLNNAYRVKVWKKMGVRMGKNCRISCSSLSPESYLIELGNDVIIARNVYLITHEGSICVFHNENPKLDLFGTIKIGDNCFIGQNSLILPNTTIGSNCIIGAGSVVRGKIPDNSVVIGNPAKVVMTTDEYRTKVFNNPVLAEYKILNNIEKKELLLKKFNITVTQ